MTEGDNNKVRLNKTLALELGISRRQADDLIADNKVTVDDAVATLGARIAPVVKVKVEGKDIALGTTKYQYLALNKPAGYVCSRKQQGDTPTIYSLVPRRYHHLKPVGRLDKDSSGLLLLSNDGDFAQTMTHPSNYKTKTYKVVLDHELEPLHQQMISDHGVELEDGNSKFGLERLTESGRLQWRVIMYEGRNRQIRRTFDSLGYVVTKLHRTHFGKYLLDNLPEGEYIQIFTL